MRWDLINKAGMAGQLEHVSYLWREAGRGWRGRLDLALVQTRQEGAYLERGGNERRRTGPAQGKA